MQKYWNKGLTCIIKPHYYYISGAQNAGRTITLLVRGSNKLVLEEAERSLHDALCVIRCLVRKKALIAGGGAPEIEVALKLSALANKLEGIDAICTRAYANALEIIPFTLAENAGLNPIQVRIPLFQTISYILCRNKVNSNEVCKIHIVFSIIWKSIDLLILVKTGDEILPH